MILFSQSAGDIQYILYLYDKYKELQRIKIYVVNVESNYMFLKSLNLNAELEFIPTKPLKNLSTYLFHITKLREIYKSSFKIIKNEDIYFFSDCYDYTTFYFIERLCQNNNVSYVNAYKIVHMEIKNIKNSIKKIIINSILGLRVYFNQYSYVYILNKKIKEINIKIDTNEINHYKYKFTFQNNSKKNLLLFESNTESNNFFVDYNRDLMSVVSKMEHYNIYIKPHPRLGYSEILNSCNVKFIDEYVPSELLELEDIDIILGIETTSIATSGFRNRYCILDLFEYSNLTRKKYIVNYLNELSQGKMTFLKNLNQLDDVLFDRKNV